VQTGTLFPPPGFRGNFLESLAFRGLPGVENNFFLLNSDIYSTDISHFCNLMSIWSPPQQFSMGLHSIQMKINKVIIPEHFAPLTEIWTLIKFLSVDPRNKLAIQIFSVFSDSRSFLFFSRKCLIPSLFSEKTKKD
jgi:hypothetical protein